jgi:hypothetical protein
MAPTPATGRCFSCYTYSCSHERANLHMYMYMHRFDKSLISASLSSSSGNEIRRAVACVV